MAGETLNPRKGVKAIAITAGTTLPIVNASVGQGMTLETDKIMAYGDEMETAVPRSVGGYEDLTIECLCDGAMADKSIGDVGDWTIKVSYWAGETATDKTFTKKYTITGISYGEVAVDGDRKATVTYTLHPIGGDAKTQTIS
jgi:hypothetical protein